MKLCCFVILIAITGHTVTANDFPSSDVQQCKINDNACVVKTVNENIFGKFKKGLPALGLNSLDPLKVDTLNIEQGGNSPVTIKLYFKDLEYSGFGDAKLTKFEGPGEKIDGGRFNLELTSSYIKQLAAYKINGKVLILPIQGSGRSNMTFDRPVLKVHATTKSVMKDNEEYMQLDKIKINIQPARLHMDFSNLFNGNKELGDNMNWFLNNNWKDIYGELRASIQTSFSGVIKNTINQVFMQVPYKKMFLPA